MKTKKKINLGEYIINIVYDDVTSSLDISVLDELEELIDSITITNDNDEIDPNLN